MPEDVQERKKNLKTENQFTEKSVSQAGASLWGGVEIEPS